MTKSVLLVSAILEGLTGLALLLIPSLVAQLLLGEQLVGAAILIAMVANIHLARLRGGGPA